MSQQYRYPNSAQISVAAVGPNGLPIPTQSIEVGAEDPSGNLQPLQVDSSGNLLVSDPAGSTAGLATEATLLQVDADVVAMSAKLPATLGQKTSANSLAVVLSSDQSSIAVTGPLTDAQLRATAVPVSGPLTDVQLRATAVPVSGPLTDAQIRATALPVSGPLTDTQLRASAVPVSLASSPLPTGAATAANQVTALSRLAGSLVPTAYDEVQLTYVTVGNGIGQIATAVYKLAAVTVKTLTLSYDGSDRLSGVVAS